MSEETNSEEPLGMPKGSVRAILVLVSLFGALGILLYKGEVPEWFIALLTGAFGFYFGTRSTS